jgi:hypothetical protein
MPFSSANWHPVVNCFARPLRRRGCDSGLQIDNPEIDADAFEFLKRLTPDVIEADWSLKCAVRFFGKIDIVPRVAHVRFVQNRIHRVRLRLIDAAACHHIAAQKHPQRRLRIHFSRKINYVPPID